MPAIRFQKFKGIIPKLSPKLLPENAAQTAKNCKLFSGRLEPLLAPKAVDGTEAHAEKSTIYLWRRTVDSVVSTEWLSWNTDVDVAPSPIADDQYNRIYYSGDGVPKVKGLDEGSVVTRNMATAIANAPVAAPAYYFTDGQIASITCALAVYYDGVFKETIVAYLSSYRRLEYALELTYHFTFPDMPDTVRTLYVRPQLVLTGLGKLPATLDSDIGAIFRESIPLFADIGNGRNQYGTFQVIGLEEKGVGMCTTTGRPRFEKKFLIDMHYTRKQTEYVYYVQTIVDDWGTEGVTSEWLPADLEIPEPHRSAITRSYQVKWGPGQYVVVGGLLSWKTVGGGTPTKWYLYRSAAGSGEDAFFFVAEGNTAGYFDEIPAADLGEELPYMENVPDDVKGFIMMPGMFLAGFRGKEILFSEYGLPHSWPTEYRLTVDYDVVGMAASGNDLVVLTTGTPYLISGIHPENMTQTKLMVHQACVSKSSIAQVGSAVCYASPDGLVMIQGAQAKVVTEDIFSKADWQAYHPESIMAEVYDGKYIAFTDLDPTVGIIVDFVEGLALVTTHDRHAHSLYNDIVNDTLYLSGDAEIEEWDAGDPLTLTWRCKEWPTNRRMNWNSGRIVADSYPVTLRLYSDNALVQSISVADQTSFRLPIMVPERTWSLEVENDDAIDYVIVGTSMGELKTL